MSAFDRLVDDISAVLWELSPAWAVYLGRHEYDGAVPDWSPATVDGHLSRLEALRRGLHELDGLDQDQELDRVQLTATIDSELFQWEILRWWRRNPMEYIFPLGVETYLNRSYAPMAHRAAKIADVVEAVPRLLGQGKENLERVVPRTFCQWAITMANGAAGFLTEGLPDAVGALHDPRLADRVSEAIETAAGALRDYADWVEAELMPKADDGFAIGSDNMEELLRRGELVSMDLEELLAIGEADLAANLAAFRETAAAIDPDLEPRQAYDEHVASVHFTAQELIPSTEAMLEEIRTFLIDHDIISVPSEVRARVAETPRHLRFAFAMMDTPGPYETEATEAYYYVTPVEDDWEEEQAQQWLKTLNRYALEATSIHEAYPGHYVHFLHYDHAPTETSKRTWSYAFVEGWAHYTEQMMWEQGYRGGDDRFRLAQLSEALVRNCRLVCAIKMHTQGMSVDEATRFFVDNAYYEETAARKEAERGTFDPGYFSYTLGKLQILRLREDYRKAMGDGYSLREFHDRLLSRGAPPVELMRRVMLP
ncbi:MAG: DUF885 domain-containing protein [Acidimicrobiia bacterium]